MEAKKKIPVAENSQKKILGSKNLHKKIPEVGNCIGKKSCSLG